MEQHDQFGYLLFKPNDIQKEDIPKEQADDGSKTLSQQLRNRLFVLHSSLGGAEIDFETFRRQRMFKMLADINDEIRAAREMP